MGHEDLDSQIVARRPRSAPAGRAKSTFAQAFPAPRDSVVGRLPWRDEVSDEENNQTVTNDAFEVLHFIAAKRLALGRLTVIDATNVQPEARKPLVALARQYDPLSLSPSWPDLLSGSVEDRHRQAATTATSARPSSASSSPNGGGRCSGLAKEDFRVHVVPPIPEKEESATISPGNANGASCGFWGIPGSLLKMTGQVIVDSCLLRQAGGFRPG